MLFSNLICSVEKRPMILNLWKYNVTSSVGLNCNTVKRVRLSSLMRCSLSKDFLWPILLEKRLRALDRRLEIVLRVIKTAFKVESQQQRSILFIYLMVNYYLDCPTEMWEMCISQIMKVGLFLNLNCVVKDKKSISSSTKIQCDLECLTQVKHSAVSDIIVTRAFFFVHRLCYPFSWKSIWML